MFSSNKILETREDLESALQRASRVKVLDISFPGYDFREYGEELGKLTGLKELSIQFNHDYSHKFTLPEELGELKSLRKLHLLNYFFEEIPQWIFRLGQLENLMLRGNDIREIPSEIAKLVKLKHLRIENTLLESIPDELSRLENLQTLSLVDNFQLKKFNRRAVGKNLKWLALGASGVPSEEVGQLKSLFPGVKFNKRYFG